MAYKRKEAENMEVKAVYRIRRIVLVNTEIIEEYLENFREL